MNIMMKGPDGIVYHTMAGAAPEAGGNSTVVEYPIFGGFANTDIIAITIVFILVLVLLMFIEFLFDKLQVLAEKYNQQEIFQKLKYELMVLGVLSFFIFLLDAGASKASTDFMSSDFFHAFEIAHIVILFIAFAFIIQAIFLAQYAFKSGRVFLKIVRTSESDLLHQYRQLIFDATGKSRLAMALMSGRERDAPYVPSLGKISEHDHTPNTNVVPAHHSQHLHLRSLQLSQKDMHSNNNHHHHRPSYQLNNSTDNDQELNENNTNDSNSLSVKSALAVSISTSATGLVGVDGSLQQQQHEQKNNHGGDSKTAVLSPAPPVFEATPSRSGHPSSDNLAAVAAGVGNTGLVTANRSYSFIDAIRNMSQGVITTKPSTTDNKGEDEQHQPAVKKDDDEKRVSRGSGSGLGLGISRSSSRNSLSLSSPVGNKNNSVIKMNSKNNSRQPSSANILRADRTNSQGLIKISGGSRSGSSANIKLDRTRSSNTSGFIRIDHKNSTNVLTSERSDSHGNVIKANRTFSVAQITEDIVELSENISSQLKPMLKTLKFKNFWNKIEFKIIEELFLLCHNLPRDFNFGAYVGYRFQKYIAEVGNISPLSWLLLAIFMVIHYTIYVIEFQFADEECPELKEGEICYVYTFSYALVMDTLLNIFILCVYFTSTYYEHMLIRSGMRRSFNVDIDRGSKSFCLVMYHAVNEAWGLNAHDVHTNDVHKAYIKCLEILEEVKRNETSASMLQRDRSSSLRASSYFVRASMFIPDKNALTHDHTGVNATATHDGDVSVVKNTNKQTKMNRIRNILLKLEKTEVMDMHNKEIKRHTKRHCKTSTSSSSYSFADICNPLRWYLYLKRKFTAYTSSNDGLGDSSDRMELETSRIFFLSSPWLYFLVVEFTFLLQSFYLAIYLTQLLPMSVESKSVGWGIALVISPIIGLMFLRLILSKSVLLHATCFLNKELVGKVCEETIQEVTLTDDVRREILKNIEEDLLKLEAKRQARHGYAHLQVEDEKNSSSSSNTCAIAAATQKSLGYNNSGHSGVGNVGIIGGDKRTRHRQQLQHDREEEYNDNEGDNVVVLKSEINTDGHIHHSPHHQHAVDSGSNAETVAADSSDANAIITAPKSRYSFTGALKVGLTEAMAGVSGGQHRQAQKLKDASNKSSVANKAKDSNKSNYSNASRGSNHVVESDSSTHSSHYHRQSKHQLTKEKDMEIEKFRSEWQDVHLADKVITHSPFSTHDHSGKLETQSSLSQAGMRVQRSLSSAHIPIPHLSSSTSVHPDSSLLRRSLSLTPHSLAQSLATFHSSSLVEKQAQLKAEVRHREEELESSRAVIKVSGEMDVVTNGSSSSMKRIGGVPRHEPVFTGYSKKKEDSGSIISDIPHRKDINTTIVATEGKLKQDVTEGKKAKDLFVVQGNEEEEAAALITIRSASSPRVSATDVTKLRKAPMVTSFVSPRTAANAIATTASTAAEMSSNVAARPTSATGTTTAADKEKEPSVITDRQKIEYIRDKFESIDLDNSGEIDKLEFRRFLGDLKVYLSRDKFNLLWKVVDENLSNAISEDEIFVFIFPEMKQALKEELAIVGDLRALILEILESRGPVKQWGDYLHEAFVQYAQYETSPYNALDKLSVQGDYTYKGGKMAKRNIGHTTKANPNLMTTEDMRQMMESVGIEADGSGFKLLLNIIELNAEGLVTFETFCRLVLSPDDYDLVFPNNSVFSADGSGLVNGAENEDGDTIVVGGGKKDNNNNKNHQSSTLGGMMARRFSSMALSSLFTGNNNKNSSSSSSSVPSPPKQSSINSSKVAGVCGDSIENKNNALRQLLRFSPTNNNSHSYEFDENNNNACDDDYNASVAAHLTSSPSPGHPDNNNNHNINNNDNSAVGHDEDDDEANKVSKGIDEVDLFLSPAAVTGIVGEMKETNSDYNIIGTQVIEFDDSTHSNYREIMMIMSAAPVGSAELRNSSRSNNTNTNTTSSSPSIVAGVIADVTNIAGLGGMTRRPSTLHQSRSSIGSSSGELQYTNKQPLNEVDNDEQLLVPVIPFGEGERGFEGEYVSPSEIIASRSRSSSSTTSSSVNRTVADDAAALNMALASMRARENNGRRSGDDDAAVDSAVIDFSRSGNRNVAAKSDEDDVSSVKFIM